MEVRAYIGWETPVARVGGGAVAPGGTIGPLPPARDLFANLKKNKLRSCRSLLGRQDPFAPGPGDRGVFSKIFKTDIYF